MDDAWWWLDSQHPECCMSVQLLGNLCELSRWYRGHGHIVRRRQHPYDAWFRVVTSFFLGPTYVGVRPPAARVSP